MAQQIFFKVYLNNEDEREQLENLAKDAGLSVSGYLRNLLPFKSATAFHLALEKVITLAEQYAESSPNSDFCVPDLFTPIAWRELTNNVNGGQIGKRFLESVSSGRVNRVSPVKGKLSRGLALYHTD